MLSRVTGLANKVVPELAKDAATEVAKSAVSVGQSAAASAGSAAISAGSVAANAALTQAGSGKERFQELLAHLKARLNQLITQKIYAFAEERVIDRVPGFVKDATDDPEMPRAVARAKDKAIDSLWPDVKEEVMWELAVLLDRSADEEAAEESRPARCCLLAFFRYHLFPYDKSFWGKLRDPAWVLITLLTLVPVWAVSPAFFFFIFLIIDKGDTFQLIQFILQFKGTQFLSVGLIRCIVGYVNFVFCVTATGRASDHTCEDTGPGRQDSFFLAAGGFFVQVLLTWMAFLLLPCSEQKGRAKLSGRLAGDEVGGAVKRRGGHLLALLIYDLFVFVACMGVLAYTFTTVDSADSWVISHAIFSLQILYGFAAMPFFLFTLPGVQLLLTHAVRTGYDPQGRCRKMRKPKKLEENHQKQEGATKKALTFFTDAEVGEVFEDVKGMLPDQVKALLRAAEGAGSGAKPEA